MEKRVVFKNPWLPYLLIAPQIIITVIFFLWPAVLALYKSVLLEDAFGMSSKFVGALNFIELFEDSLYINSLWTTIIFSVAVAFSSMSLALYLAAMAERVIKGALVYKTFLIWPYAVAPVIAGFLWVFLFNPATGLLAVTLKALGYDWNYLLNGGEAMFLVVIAASWKQIAYNFLFFLAGMQAIPKSLIEAAAIDGASPGRRFWDIIFPLLSPTTFFLLVMNIVYAFFDTFGIIHSITKGGPGQSTSILVYKVFSDGFIGLDLGGSSAQSVILMIIVIVLTVIQFRYIEKKVNY
ncbi:MAG: sn-glycerol-3-phosphate ABC transporter permease UgpA [Proteobacteria bacterium]|nr:sn-glycerol-3-phosphate ABC transporter permease UgpA [Pseudomonadota bacterium]